MKPSRQGAAAALIAVLGIVAGNTVANFTNDAERDILGGSSTPSVTLTCTANP